MSATLWYCAYGYSFNKKATMMFRQSILSLIFLTIINLGMVQAGVDFCASNCNHCTSYVDVSPCCNEEPAMSGNGCMMPEKDNSNSHSSSQCNDSLYCQPGRQAAEVAQINSAPSGFFIAVIINSTITASEIADTHSALDVERASLNRVIPPLYNLNCSFLI